MCGMYSWCNVVVLFLIIVFRTRHFRPRSRFGIGTWRLENFSKSLKPFLEKYHHPPAEQSSSPVPIILPVPLDSFIDKFGCQWYVVLYVCGVWCDPGMVSSFSVVHCVSVNL